MRAGWVERAFFTLLVAGCTGSTHAHQNSPDAGGRTQGSAAGASGQADAGRVQDAGFLDAAAPDAGRLADSGSADAARDAGRLADSGNAAARDTGVAGAGRKDSGTSSVPPALLAFAEDVRRASEQGQAVGAGPFSCAAPLPAIEVMSAADAASAVREYVAAMLGVPVSELHEEVQDCGDASQSRTACANMFNLFSGSFGGRVSETIFPLAQQLDSDSMSERLTIYTTGQSGSLQVVVLSAEKADWLTGIAVFGNRADCAPSA